MSKSNDGGGIAIGPKVSGGSQRSILMGAPERLTRTIQVMSSFLSQYAIKSTSYTVLILLRVHSMTWLKEYRANNSFPVQKSVSTESMCHLTLLHHLRWLPPETFGPVAISPPSLDLDTSTLESILHIYQST